MQETQRLDTQEEDRTTVASAPPEESRQQSQGRDDSSSSQQGDTTVPGSGMPPLDERDLQWLRLLYWMLIQQADTPPYASAVESDPPLANEAVQEDDGVPDGEPVPTPITLHHRRRAQRSLLPMVSVGLVGVGLLLLFGLLIAVPPLAPTATVTILPTTAMLTTTTTVTVVTDGTSDVTRHEIAGRLLPSLTLSQARTVPTTGKGHQDARAAHGMLTLYNALPAVQTIPAGTLLTGANGVQVVTGQDAVIPAGSLSVNGRVSVPARALNPGPQGNISADDIYGACCRANIFAQNTAPFTGGQDARSFAIVTEQDISEVTTALAATLAQSVQAAFQAQVHRDEGLITPVDCTPSVTSNHAAGEEASQVRVTVAEACIGEVYNTQAMQRLVTGAVTQGASRRLGASYRLIGDVQTTIVQSTLLDQKPGMITLRVRGVASWVYQFSQQQLLRFETLIAGKSKAQATQLLQRQPGVRTVAISIAGGSRATLPTDPYRIHMVMLYGIE